MALDTVKIRAEFPLLAAGDIIYLDNAATTQKPQSILDAMNDFYGSKNANINRGVHKLAEAATVAYGNARTAVQKFINAKRSHEIIFTRNTTEAINLVARTFGETLNAGDAIALTLLEHHSNIVPWQQLAERKKLEIRWIGITDDGKIDLKNLDEILSDKKVKLITISAVSNVLGTIAPLKEIINRAHNIDAKVLVDAAQLISHAEIDVQDLNADFLAFSGHKVYGPTGIGVLYGKAEVLEMMPPFMSGGDMIQNVTTDGFTAAELPRKFEAGTPAIAEAIGLHAAINWIQTIGLQNIAAHEKNLLKIAIEQLSNMQPANILTLLGPKDASKIASCVSFTAEGIHPHDLTQMLSEKNIMLRAGHHCAQPLHRHLGITASTRLSVAIYNTEEEIIHACDAVKSILTAWPR